MRQVSNLNVIRSMKTIPSLLAWVLLVSVCLVASSQAAAPLKTLDALVQGNGSVTLDPSGGSYPRGTAVTLTALPGDGWTFDHWQGGAINGSAANPVTITMYTSYTITAVFTQPTGVDAVRKTDFDVRVTDSQGQPIEGVTVDAKMTEIDFAFGVAITAEGLSYPSYRNWVKDNYNWAVAGNEAKWYANEPLQGLVSYYDADEMYAFCQENGLRMRGHTVFWALPSTVQQWVQDLPFPAELQAAVDSRLDSVVNHFKGKYLHWDVNNEMLHGSFYQDRLGSGIRPYMFNRVKTIDPNVVTFVNDYNVISGGYSLTDYVNLITNLLASGAQIDAIGVQGHFSGGDTMAEISQRLDTLAAFGLPIWVTEYDYVDSDPVARADYLEAVFRTVFGHPAVEGLVTWGFWADDHWRGPDAALLDSNFSVNEAGQRYLALRDEWWTQANGVTDLQGDYVFNGFYGDYEITLTNGSGVSEVHTVSFPRSGGVNPVVTLEFGTGTAPDVSAPNPDPAAWNVPPSAATRDVIVMSATEALDVSGVEYYFSNLTDPSHDSDWQNSPVYIDSGLSPETQYSYDVVVRDKSLNQNITGLSTAAAATTLADDGNILVNEGFEYGTTAGWRGFASASLNEESTIVHDGAFAARAFLRTQTYDGIAQQLASRVTNGVTYQCSAWVRLANATSDSIAMTIRQVDQTGTSYFGVAYGTATDTGWTQLTGTFTLGYTGTLSDLTLYVEGPAVGVDYYVDSVQVAPQVPANGGDVHVATIDMGFASKGPNVNGTASIQIVDENGVGVPGAIVAADWSGDVAGSVSDVTDGQGFVALSSPTKRNGGLFIVTVTDVSATGFVYNPSLNVETSDSITAP